MTDFSVIRYADLPPIPWRNGLGITRSIRAMTDGGGWSLSVATITQPAEFSLLPSTQRVQLAIDPVRLSIDGERLELGAHDRARFTGEQHVVGESAVGSSRVLNLMWSDSHPELELLVDGHGTFDGGVRAIVLLTGNARFNGVALDELDTVFLPDTHTPASASLETDAQLAVIRRPAAV